MNLTLIIVTGMSVLAAGLIYIANKKIAASIYTRTYLEIHGRGKKKSPYSIVRTYDRHGNAQYHIVQKNKELTPKSLSLQITKESMWELETLNNYDKTKFED